MDFSKLYYYLMKFQNWQLFFSTLFAALLDNGRQSKPITFFIKVSWSSSLRKKNTEFNNE